MRNLTLACSLVLVCAIAPLAGVGCTDPITALSDMGVADLAPDLSALVDLAGPDYTGVSCGTQTCSGTNICCITDLQSGNPQAACTTAAACTNGIVAACDGPEDCATAGSACCATVELLGGGDAGASSGNGGAECKSTCNFAIAGDYRSAQTKLCHVDADCAGYKGNLPLLGQANLDKCCHATQAPQVHFCGQALSIAGFSIQCP